MTNAISQPYGCPPTWARVLRTIAVVLFWLPLILYSFPVQVLFGLLGSDAIIFFHDWHQFISIGCALLGWGLLCAAGSDWIVRAGTGAMVAMMLYAIVTWEISNVDIAYFLPLFLHVYGLSLLIRHPQLERRKRVWCLLLVVQTLAVRIDWCASQISTCSTAITMRTAG